MSRNGVTRLALACTMVVMIASCAEQRPPIDRTQANILRKSLFDSKHEWYFQQTIVDVPGTANLGIVGWSNFAGVERVRWDIQQKFLYARRSYEKNKNAEKAADKEGYKGAIIAAYAIESHFDIKYDYNETTGEERNVLIENTSDRPWYQREYMRVDWSQNLATNFFLPAHSLNKTTGAPEKLQSPVSFWAEKDTANTQDYEDYKPVFDEKAGYIDVTNVMAVEPGTTYLDGYGFVPQCWLFDKEAADCTTEVMKFRNSFWRVDPAHSYEARSLDLTTHDIKQTEWFGFFTSDRLVYDDKYTISQKNRERYLNRHNIWKSSHVATSTCTSDSQCSGHAAGTDYLGRSRCDRQRAFVTTDKTTGKSSRVFRCTVPLKQREVRPIVYHTNRHGPRALACDKDASGKPQVLTDKNGVKYCAPFTANTPAAQRSVLHKISDDYNATFSDVVQKVTGKRPALAFVVCPNNPVRDTDPAACRCPPNLAERGACPKNLAPRPGDVRFSFVNWVHKYYEGFSLLGLGPSNSDPLTGEIISGTANMYVYNDWAATRVQEMVQLLNGDIRPDRFVDGVNAVNWVKQAKKGGAGRRTVSGDQLAKMYKATAPRGGTASTKPLSFLGLDKYKGSALQHRRLLLSSAHNAGLFNGAGDKSEGKLRSLKGTPLESSLVNNEILLAMGIRPGSKLSKELLAKASISRGGLFGLLDAMDKHRLRLTERNAYLAEMADDAIIGLARDLKKKKLTPQQIWDRARELIMTAVTTHEMGHSLGLKHNFAGSEDVFNYHQGDKVTDAGYWNLRPARGTKTPAPRWKPPTSTVAGAISEKELSGCIHDHAYSSIMDYAARYTLDGMGLGRYDRAALMYGYGGLVETFKTARDSGKHLPAAFQQAFSGNVPPAFLENYFSDLGNPLMLYGGAVGPVTVHYTDWYRMMGPKMWSRDNRQYVPAEELQYVNKVSGPQDAKTSYIQATVRVKRIKQTCQPGAGAAKDGCPALSTCTDEDGDGKGDYCLALVANQQNDNMPYVRVPYLFCAETKADISEGCLRRDYGADIYERMRHHVQDYDTWYLTRNFPRYKAGVRPEKHHLRHYKRIFRRLKGFNDTYALYRRLMPQWYASDPKVVQSFFTKDSFGWGGYTLAVNDAFNMAARALTTPHVTSYQASKLEDGTAALTESPFSTNMSLDITQGRYFATSWYTTNNKDTCGYQWWECLHHIGYYVDKIMALHALSESQTYFVARDTAEDIRQWRISFFNDFSSQIQDLVGGVLTGDFKGIAPYFNPSSSNAYCKANPAACRCSDYRTGAADGGCLLLRDYATPALDPKSKDTASLSVVDPYTGFTVQLYAAVLGMARFSHNFDTSFVDSSRMWKLKHGGQVQVEPTAEISGPVTYTDPFTGQVYGAIGYKDKKGIAQRMVKRAQLLKDRTSYCLSKPQQGGASGVCPKGCASCAADGLTAAARAEARAKLKQYKQLLDIVVDLNGYYDSHAKYSDPYDPGSIKD